MEKHKPHYQLTEIQALVVVCGMAAFTQTARINSLLMGLTADQSLAIIASLTPAMFFKSMTTHHDHRVWQDVYHAPCSIGKTAYIKLTLQAGSVVIQFKER
ncbi:MAG: type II toxin-antitoxin system MqsR family toxin [Rhodoferax sp.]